MDNEVFEFQVGDHIIGKPHNGYSITDDQCECIVERVYSNGNIRVLALTDNDHYDVEAYCFVPLAPAKGLQEVLGW